MTKAQDVVAYNQIEPFKLHHPLPTAWNVSIHVHDACEIYQALVDDVSYFVEGNAYNLMRGDIIITNRNELHRPFKPDTAWYDRRFIQFKLSEFMPFFDTGYNPLRLFTNRTLGVGNLITCNEDSLANTLINQIESLSTLVNPKNQVKIKILLIQLFTELETQHQEASPQSSKLIKVDQRVLAILEYINTNFDQAISLDQLSAKYFLNKYYLCHLFKNNTGFSIREYIQSKRIQKAKQLIAEGNAITSTSIICGYDDYANFYKAFNKLVGMSPSDYLKTVH